MLATSLISQTIQDSFNLIWLLWGLFLAGILEAFLWKTPLLTWANFPIQADWFGENKRWRGLLSLPLTHLVVTWGLQGVEQFTHLVPSQWVLFSDFNGWEYGLLVGLACNLAELPNSFLKRRLNIPPGGANSGWFYVIDHSDSATGILLMWWLFFPMPQHLLIVGAIISPLLFMAATTIRVRLGLK